MHAHPAAVALLATALLIATPALGANDDPPAATSLAWGSTAALGDTAFAMDFRLEAEGSCTFTHLSAGAAHPRGGPFWFGGMATPDGNESVSSAAAIRNHVVHTEAADLREPIRVTTAVQNVTVFPTGGWSASSVTTNNAELGYFFEPGQYSLIGGGLDLAPSTDTGRKSGDWSLYFEAACDVPVTLLGYRGSHEVLTFTGHSMDGGTGAYESLVVDANVGASESATFTSPTRTFISQRTYQDGAHHGELRWLNDDGETVFDLTEDHQFQRLFVGPPGEHTWELDRVSADFFAGLTVVQVALPDLDNAADIEPVRGG